MQIWPCSVTFHSWEKSTKKFTNCNNISSQTEQAGNIKSVIRNLQICDQKCTTFYPGSILHPVFSMWDLGCFWLRKWLCPEDKFLIKHFFTFIQLLWTLALNGTISSPAGGLVFYVNVVPATRWVATTPPCLRWQIVRSLKIPQMLWGLWEVRKHQQGVFPEQLGTHPAAEPWRQHARCLLLYHTTPSSWECSSLLQAEGLEMLPVPRNATLEDPNALLIVVNFQALWYSFRVSPNVSRRLGWRHPEVPFHLSLCMWFYDCMINAIFRLLFVFFLIVFVYLFLTLKIVITTKSDVLGKTCLNSQGYSTRGLRQREEWGQKEEIALMVTKP